MGEQQINLSSNPVLSSMIRLRLCFSNSAHNQVVQTIFDQCLKLFTRLGVSSPSCTDGLVAPRTPILTPINLDFYWNALSEAEFNLIQNALIQNILPLSKNHSLAAASLLKSHERLSQIKLAAFDMDSTLINEEVIDELGALLGIKNKIAYITEQAMTGELTFDAALRERVLLLAGLHQDQVLSLTTRLTPTHGAQELIQFLLHEKCYTLALSGGFNLLLTPLQKIFQLHEARGNTLELDQNQKLTGKILGEPFGPTEKKKQLLKVANEKNILAHQIMAVGDGANDIEMLSAANLKVAFCAKPKLNLHANTWIIDRNLTWIINATS